LKISLNQLNPNGFWNTPLVDSYSPSFRDLDLFDQNGYDLSQLEQQYSKVNECQIHTHRHHRVAIKSDWFIQSPIIVGAHLNHSMLLERKAYDGSALVQLNSWAKELPLLYKVIAMRPKWGLDFSMDYVDYEGNSFEVLHWEWDSFNYDEVMSIKECIEPKLYAIDWDDAAKQLLVHKDQWHHLDFFKQSDYKCNFFGVPKEQFKMVLWQ
jgi:hypothetical protein